MKPEAFVYLWRDSKNKKFYLGYHKGTPDDSYAHSSSVMESFSMNSVPDEYKRRILAWGSSNEMIELETNLLKNRKERGRWYKYHNISINASPYLWCDQEYRERMSEQMSVHLKERWKDPEFRTMMSEQMSDQLKEWWQDPEYRKNRSEQTSINAKKLWENPEHRKMMSEQMSVQLKGQWQDPEFKTMQSEKTKAQWEDPEFRTVMSEQRSVQLKGQWEDPEFRTVMSEQRSVQLKGQWQDPEYRTVMSEQSKELWKDPEYRKKQRATCSVCGHESSKSAIGRWHNDNCKFKEDNND